MRAAEGLLHTKAKRSEQWMTKCFTKYKWVAKCLAEEMGNELLSALQKKWVPQCFTCKRTRLDTIGNCREWSNLKSQNNRKLCFLKGVKGDLWGVIKRCQRWLMRCQSRIRRKKPL